MIDQQRYITCSNVNPLLHANNFVFKSTKIPTLPNYPKWIVKACKIKANLRRKKPNNALLSCARGTQK